MYNCRMKKVTLFRATSYRNGAEFIIDKLRNVSPTDLSVRHIVIVPDRASMSAEQLVLSHLTGSFNVEVRTLRQYANEICRNVSDKYLSKQAGIMVLTKIIFDNASKLVCYEKGIHNNGFVEGIYEIISQLMYARIKSQNIKTEKMPPALKDKMTDIKLIYSCYEEYLTEGYVDSARRLEMLISAIEGSEKIKNSYFYFYDFESLTAQEQAIINSLAVTSRGVYVAYAYSQDPYLSHLYSDEIDQALKGIADNFGDEAEIITQEKNLYPDNFTEQIGQNMYSCRKTDPLAIPAERLTLCQAPSLNAEVECLAQDICDFVRRGNRYKDYFVICSDVSKYRLAVERIFADYEIPYFTDTQIKLSEHPLSQYVMDFLAMCKNNYKLDSTLCFVKNYFFSTDPAVFAFENYCLKYNAGYNYEKFELGTKDDKIGFSSADKVREKLYGIIQSYKFDENLTTKEKIEVIKKLLSEQNIEQKCLTLAEECDKSGETQFVSATRQAYSKLIDLLTQFENILGNTHLTNEDFIRILTAGIGSQNISVLPTRNDCVVLANMAKSRKHDIVALGLLGATENAMPIVKKDTKLLNDANLRALSSCGLKILGKTATENKLERLSLYQLLLETREHLYVSCCEKQTATALGETASPSQFFTILKGLFCIDKGTYPVITAPRLDKVYTQNNALGKLSEALRKQKDFVLVTNPNYELLKKEFGKTLLPYEAPEKLTANISNGELLFKTIAPTTVSKLESFYECPCKHYFRYGLKLKPREISELNVNDFGNILHEVLEIYIGLMSKQETDKKTKELANDCFERVARNDFYNGIMNDARRKAIVNLLRKESVALCLAVKNQLKESDFNNYKAELKFGSDDVPAISIKDGDNVIKLEGKIDRIDVCDDEFIIIDYKSGSTGAEYSEAKLYAGKKLQLLIYLAAVEDNIKMTVGGVSKKRKAVGFYYMRLHDRFVEDQDSRYGFEGRTLANREVIAKLDKNFSVNRKSQLLNIALNNDGEFSKRSRVLTEEQLKAQKEYAKEAVKSADRLIKQGYVLETPLNPEEACKYCDYSPICCALDMFPEIGRSLPTGINAETFKLQKKAYLPEQPEEGEDEQE